MTRKNVSVQDFAAQLGCHPATVWRYAKNDPRFPKPFRIGAMTRWSQDDIDAYLSQAREAA